LQAESRLNGDTYRILEVTAVTFDEEFAPETLATEPPLGLTWQEVSATTRPPRRRGKRDR